MAEVNEQNINKNGDVHKLEDVALQSPASEQYGAFATGDKLQLIDDGTVGNHTELERKEFSPLHIQDGSSGKNVASSEGLKVIVASSVVFAVSVTIALIITIYLGPPQVKPMGAVAADNTYCSNIGVDILKKGGHALEAAIAATFCLGVTMPQNSGIGGGGFMLVHDHLHKISKVYDFRCTAPAGVKPEMYTDENKAYRGGLSVAVPGEVAGLERAYNDPTFKKYMKLSWKQLIEPSIKLARDGFNVSKALVEAVEHHFDRVDENITAMFGKLKEGQFIKRPDLANVLEAIAEKGSKALTEGEYAQEIVDTVKQSDGVLKMSDLKNYETLVKDPIRFRYHDFELLSAPAPSGGPILLYIMNILNSYRFQKSDQRKPVTYHRMIEAFKFGYAQKLLMGDPAFTEMTNITEHLLDESFGNETMQKINDNKTFLDPGHYGLKGTLPVDAGTSQVTVIGSKEDMVSLTTSVNYYFGSGLMTKSGIILNDDIWDFSFPNLETPEFLNKVNNIEPGKRPLSSMSPSVVHMNNKPCGLRIAISGVNGYKIISGIAEVLVNMLAFGDTPEKAVKAPRVHNQLQPNVTEYENMTGIGTLTDDVLKGLEDRGHILKPSSELLSDINVASKINETYYGYSDPRKYAKAGVFN